MIGHLERALDRDPEVSVRLAALGALMSCLLPGQPRDQVSDHPPGQGSSQTSGQTSGQLEGRIIGLGARLLRVAADREQPADVRQRAITLTGSLSDRAPGSAAASIGALTRELLVLFGQLRRQAWSDAGAVRLAAATAAALGRLGHVHALEPLLSAARDEAFPALQAAAITGLSAMCPPALAPLLDRYAQSDQRSVALAVRRARERCR